MSPGGQLYTAALLSAVLLLLSVEKAKPQTEGSDFNESSEESSQETEMPSTDQNQDNHEEHFEVSSVGEMWQNIDMAKQEEEEMSKSASVHTYVFDLAFCFNLASIMVFL